MLFYVILCYFIILISFFIQKYLFILTFKFLSFLIKLIFHSFKSLFYRLFSFFHKIYNLNAIMYFVNLFYKICFTIHLFFYTINVYATIRTCQILFYRILLINSPACKISRRIPLSIFHFSYIGTMSIPFRMCKRITYSANYYLLPLKRLFDSQCQLFS